MQSFDRRHSLGRHDFRNGEKHKSRLVAEFSRLLVGKTIRVLDIPDDYKYMDPELVEQLEQSVNAILYFDWGL